MEATREMTLHAFEIVAIVGAWLCFIWAAVRAFRGAATGVALGLLCTGCALFLSILVVDILAYSGPVKIEVEAVEPAPDASPDPAADRLLTQPDVTPPSDPPPSDPGDGGVTLIPAEPSRAMTLEMLTPARLVASYQGDTIATLTLAPGDRQVSFSRHADRLDFSREGEPVEIGQVTLCINRAPAPHECSGTPVYSGPATVIAAP